MGSPLSGRDRLLDPSGPDIDDQHGLAVFGCHRDAHTVMKELNAMGSAKPAQRNRAADAHSSDIEHRQAETGVFLRSVVGDDDLSAG